MYIFFFVIKITFSIIVKRCKIKSLLKRFKFMTLVNCNQKISPIKLPTINFFDS